MAMQRDLGLKMGFGGKELCKGFGGKWASKETLG